MQYKHVMRNIEAVALLLLLVLTGCSKENGSHSFWAVSETSADADTKTCLVNESFVYWQDGDMIDVRNVSASTSVVAEFSSQGSEGVQSLFIVDPEQRFASDRVFFALFPHNDNNSLGSGSDPNISISISNEQGYVDDNTFGRTACPMVAYRSDSELDENGVARILFHNLCGLVRIQLCDNVSTSKNIESIQFTSTSQQQLSGMFSVNGYKSHNPYLTASGSSSDDYTVTICDINQPTTATPLTFYLALPAVNSTGGATEYKLQMRVKAKGTGSYEGNNYYVTMPLTVPVRRNGITKMPALSINSWAASENGVSEASATIAGNGTRERPFLIYTGEDLCKVRDVFNSSGSLNGINVRANLCYYKIMRSDIVLGSGEGETEWTEGIHSFYGNLIYGANQSSSTDRSGQPRGIMNKTGVPIFESIAENGMVQNLVVNCNYSGQTDNAGYFSPLCNVNHGRIANCRIGRNSSYVVNYTASSGEVGVAGICVQNTGIISGCGCAASLRAPWVAGICLYNMGTISGCYISSPMQVAGGTFTNALVRAAGICYNNSGIVNDCYFAANINTLSTVEWGGIVYQNSDGGTVKHCYTDASGIIQSCSSIGGIVHTMTGGVVDNCWNDADLMNVQGGTGGLGGIVYSLTGGEVRNCIRYRPSGSFTCTCTTGGVLGGVVARMSGGAVRNSAFYGDLSQSTVAVKGAFVGNLNGGDIENVYALQTTSLGPLTRFYGTRSGTPSFYDCYGQIEVAGDVSVVANGALSNALNGHSWQGLTPAHYLQWDEMVPPMLSSTTFASKRRR